MNVFVPVHLLAPWALNVVPDHPDSTPQLPKNREIAEWHNRWFNQMQSAGWRFGHELDGGKKTHPDLLPFSSLTEQQRTGVARAFAAQVPQSLDP